MKTNTIKMFVVLSFTLFCFGIYAQSTQNIWTPVSEKSTASKTKELRNSIPSDYKLYSLNSVALQSILNNAPKRADLKTSNAIIELPVSNGEIQRFRVVDASTFAPELQRRHPNIRSFAGQGIDDPTAIARFSTSPNGMNFMISSANHATFYIDPYTKDSQAYIAYSREDLSDNLNSFVCHVEDVVGPIQNNQEIGSGNKNADDGMLRTYRLALASNAEYSYFHWFVMAGIDPSAPDSEKKAAVLAAMNVAMTRVNGIYERDVALTMEIIPNNEDIIFLNTATDGLSNDPSMINQIQAIIDGAIGSANYDIGHVFSTGGGGIAGLRVPCVSGQKARGVTGLPNPIGDPFYVDYVAHEMGHQFGANHTFNNSCGGNRNNSTAVEPGSGSTIMAYAGICSPNVQNHSDDYFHAISIQEIWAFIKNGQGQCATQTPTNNLPPVADAGPNYTIPKSTPFILKGTATDPDGGNVLSHCWEQMNPQVAPMPPQNTSTTGPAFRSIDPLDGPDRYMPALATVLNNQTQNTWEVVPSVGRNLSFRYTVRDNVAGGGATASDNMTVTVDGGSGPFSVTSQATATTWTIGNTETITWDVAGTDAAPVSSPNVDIWFSTDGGQTYPITVALNVPNNGSAIVNVPNVNTTTGRFMVISSNNIFYDLNNGVITVDGTVGIGEFAFDDFAVYPNPSNGTFNLTFTPASSDKIEISLYDLRGRAINNYTFDDVSASGTFSKQLDYGYIESGMYFLVVKNGDKVATKKIVKN